MQLITLSLTIFYFCHVYVQGIYVCVCVCARVKVSVIVCSEADNLFDASVVLQALSCIKCDLLRFTMCWLYCMLERDHSMNTIQYVHIFVTFRHLAYLCLWHTPVAWCPPYIQLLITVLVLCDL